MRSLIGVLFVFLGLSVLCLLILSGLQNLGLIDLSSSEFWIISPSIGLLMSIYHFRNSITNE